MLNRTTSGKSSFIYSWNLNKIISKIKFFYFKDFIYKLKEATKSLERMTQA